MCGINGIVTTTRGSIDRSALRRMRDAQRHRGPDDDGEYLDDQAGLGFRRLSIIDLSPRGHQPMSNEDGTLWLIFNGEIYNFQSLRTELKRRGHPFRSQTDSETVIHAYEEYGERCVDHFRGMFALALWDSKKKTLFLARDRFGKKPLFYTVQNDSLYFASELQGLLAAIPKPSISQAALQYYFRLQFIPSPHTIYRGVNKLPPGHTLTWQNGQVSIKPYWKLNFTKQSISLEEAGQEFERRFREAVKLRLTSDVPLGTFLSGGLDSTIITAIMASQLKEPVKTFSIGFSEQSHNELPLARQIAKQYNTDHHELIVQPNVSDVLPMLMRHYGEPFADSSAVATYYVARETRKYVTVALTGDGGDENFAGYEKYDFLLKLKSFDVLPQPLRKVLAAIGSSAVMAMPPLQRRRLMIAADLFAANLTERYNDLFAVFSRRQLKTLLPGLDPHHDPDRLAAERIGDLPTDASLIDRVTALDLRLYLPEGLMTKADIATMANSLEARAPFLDHEVVSFTASLPDEYKINGGVQKFLLRKQFGHLLPAGLLEQPKRGFDLPVNAWLRGELKDFLRQRLTDPTFRQLPYFNHSFIDRLMSEHEQQRAHHGIRLWSLLCFSIWHQEFKA
ncbi:MAG: asparagine synthase (glutamine-hydrolyzing) [Candidatus Kerfeldbacteria bacterium]|nr:asparagine synthase (glutamine-hydrolyzing) [Candidatus Kerfeldbacteria bacterium]